MSPSPCPDWNDDLPGDISTIVANITAMWPQVLTDATSRPAPTLSIALDWHRRIYEGVTVPRSDYVGNVRDSAPSVPCLIDYEVAVGAIHAPLAQAVPAALDVFFRATASVTMTLDGVIPAGSVPSAPAVIAAVIRLCALAHGEWIRIHPFANGNGRTARLWANWLAVRYGLPPFVRIKPRPADVQFSGAVQLSMRGDHRATETMFAAMLTDALSTATSGP